MTNELSKGFTGVEVNGVRFSNVGEMLRYMDRQREQLTKARRHLKDLIYVVELGKNELATARILAEAKECLKEE